jgi:hypothetical protein
MMLRSALKLAAALPVMASASNAVAAEESNERPLTPEEVEAWLDARALPKSSDTGTAEPDVPPPPPRRHGVVLEASIGALGHTGPLKHVSPTAPWFSVRLGYEPFRWLMLFAESDVAFSSTSYASPPPEPRSYWLYGFGGGIRSTVALGERFGIFLQGSAGVARVSEENVLSIYGYEDADELSPYFSGLLGFEWYQINPHFGLALHSGVRLYSGLDRERSSSGPVAWVGALALRYAF